MGWCVARLGGSSRRRRRDRMKKRILIMGLPGSGKTVLSVEITAHLLSKKPLWLNGDAVRERFNDWDFSEEGRIRQARRMFALATADDDREFVVIDFVCPLKEMREIVKPHFIIWMNTLAEGRFEDTNAIFQTPDMYDLRIDTFDQIDINAIMKAIEQC